MSNLKRFLKIGGNDPIRRDEVDKQIDEMQQKYANKLARYKPPTDAQEWWDVLKEWWPEITAIWRQFCHFQRHISDEELLEMRRVRKKELEEFCHRAWSNAPDSGSIHAIPGWGVLCDLCSEAGVL
jgi:hypothetical protein